MPQLFLITKTGEAESITTHYLFFLGLYRALYIANWVWRYHTEGFFDQIAVVSGVVQTIFYCDFFYLYVTRGEWRLRRCCREGEMNGSVEEMGGCCFSVVASPGNQSCFTLRFSNANSLLKTVFVLPVCPPPVCSASGKRKDEPADAHLNRTSGPARSAAPVFKDGTDGLASFC